MKQSPSAQVNLHHVALQIAAWDGYEEVGVAVEEGTPDGIVVLLSSSRSLHDEDHTAVHTLLHRVVIDG